MQERKIAILLYGFPPGVGATGTAALLNVPTSLAKLLEGLQQQGYDLGPGVKPGEVDGEAIIAALKMQEEQRAIYEGKPGIENRSVNQHFASTHRFDSYSSCVWKARPQMHEFLSAVLAT